MSGQGIKGRSVGGGKFFGQRSSPEQGEQAFIWMRCSSEFGVGDGIGELIRVRVVEAAVFCRRVCMVVLRAILMVD
jgi:hypothetical protein